MKEISDEILMAWVDGELEGEQDAQVRQTLEQNPDLARRAAVFTESAAMLRVFDAPLNEEVPEPLLATVCSAPAGTWLHRLLAGLRRSFPAQSLRPIPALATLLLLVLGSWMAYRGLPGSVMEDTHFFVAGQEFSHILETTPSGQQVLLDDGSGILPLLTFQEQEGTFCRRFDLIRDKQHLGSGIACRAQADAWKMVAFQRWEESSASGEDYELAGGKDSLDQFMEEHRQGAILSLQKEQRLLRQKWQAGP